MPATPKSQQGINVANTSSQTPVPRARSWIVSLTTPEGGRIADVITAQLRSVVTRLAGRGVTPGVALFTDGPTAGFWSEHSNKCFL